MCELTVTSIGNYVWWVGYCKDIYVPQILALADALEERLLPAFENLNAEADQIEEQHWKMLCSLPGDENVDMASLAESAFDVGLTHYLMMKGLRQGIINMMAAAIYHLFEQQMMEFHKRGILQVAEERNKSLHRLPVAWKRLLEYGADVKSFSCWPTIDELRLVANTVKHAEGDSASELHSKRPELFVAPEICKDIEIDSSVNVSAPLIGEGLYISESDVVRYKEAVVDFWGMLHELAVNE